MSLASRNMSTMLAQIYRTNLLQQNANRFQCKSAEVCPKDAVLKLYTQCLTNHTECTYTVCASPEINPGFGLDGNFELVRNTFAVHVLLSAFACLCECQSVIQPAQSLSVGGSMYGCNGSAHRQSICCASGTSPGSEANGLMEMPVQGSAPATAGLHHRARRTSSSVNGSSRLSGMNGISDPPVTPPGGNATRFSGPQISRQATHCLPCPFPCLSSQTLPACFRYCILDGVNAVLKLH